MDERMLRHALMEANLERFRDVLDAAEEPDCGACISEAGQSL